jgi:hypothetical protein
MLGPVEGHYRLRRHTEYMALRTYRDIEISRNLRSRWRVRSEVPISGPRSDLEVRF